MKNLLFRLLLLCLLATAATAQTVADPLKTGFEPHLGAQLPMDLMFTDHRGREGTLSQMLDGRPALLVLGYYECPMLCHQVQEGLLDGLSGLDMTVGEEFNVLTVSIDHRETPDLAAKKRDAYLRAYGRTVEASRWPFLVGDEPSVEALASAVGFRSARVGEEIAHPAGLIVLTPQGKVSSYLYGLRFPPAALEQALKTAESEMSSESLLSQIKLLCYQYDPATGKYSLAIYRLVQLLSICMALLVFASVWRWERKRRSELG